VSHKQVLFGSAAPRKDLARRFATRRCRARHARPKSKSVLIQKSWGAPIICNDGATIAKEKDPRKEYVDLVEAGIVEILSSWPR
jgi:chaperonin GroEL